jgi:hypothetical protein
MTKSSRCRILSCAFAFCDKPFFEPVVDLALPNEHASASPRLMHVSQGHFRSHFNFRVLQDWHDTGCLLRLTTLCPFCWESPHARNLWVKLERSAISMTWRTQLYGNAGVLPGWFVTDRGGGWEEGHKRRRSGDSGVSLEFLGSVLACLAYSWRPRSLTATFHYNQESRLLPLKPLDGRRLQVLISESISGSRSPPGNGSHCDPVQQHSHPNHLAQIPHTFCNGKTTLRGSQTPSLAPSHHIQSPWEPFHLTAPHQATLKKSP